MEKSNNNDYSLKEISQETQALIDSLQLDLRFEEDYNFIILSTTPENKNSLQEIVYRIACVMEPQEMKIPRKKTHQQQVLDTLNTGSDYTFGARNAVILRDHDNSTELVLTTKNARGNTDAIKEIRNAMVLALGEENFKKLAPDVNY